MLTYQGKPFTGVGFECNENGELVAEVEYIDGQRNGGTREWFSGGRLMKKEEYYKFNARHGVGYEWYESGAIKSESEFELGVCLRRKTWNEDGSLSEDMRLDESNPQFTTLQKLRKSTIGQLG